MKHTQYTLVSDHVSEAGRLSARVVRLLEEGWELHGAPSATSGFLAQALVRTVAEAPPEFFIVRKELKYERPIYGVYEKGLQRVCWFHAEKTAAHIMNELRQCPSERGTYTWESLPLDRVPCDKCNECGLTEHPCKCKR
jgi:hypothetical protein